MLLWCYLYSFCIAFNLLTLLPIFSHYCDSFRVVIALFTHCCLTCCCFVHCLLVHCSFHTLLPHALFFSHIAFFACYFCHTFQVPTNPSSSSSSHVVVLLFLLLVWYFPSPPCHVQAKDQGLELTHKRCVVFPSFFLSFFFIHFVLFLVNVIIF